jgi:hypothetical protein
MIAQILLQISREAHYHTESVDHTRLGLLIILLVVALVAAVAFLLGRRITPPAAEPRCPRCQAPRRGKFCAICGTKF